jgi:hypothetical protein
MRFWRRMTTRHTVGEEHDNILITTVDVADYDRPVLCSHDCESLAVKLVKYLWRAMERDSFVAGETEEEVCENHFQQLVNDSDVHMISWETL